MDPPRDWPSFFTIVRTRPAMYLGGKSATRLDAFINGFQIAEAMHGLEGWNGFDFDGFRRFVETKTWESSRGPCSTALEVAGGDEGRAFDLYFEWYDEFCNRRPA